jgi:hypothetical protein
MAAGKVSTPSLVTRRNPGKLRHETRDRATALAFMKKTLKRQGNVEAIVTDGLRSYRATMTELGCEQRKSLQIFASVHTNFYNHFNQERHLVDRQTYKQRRVHGKLPGLGWKKASIEMPFSGGRSFAKIG